MLMVIAVINQKGGVGKTTTAVNLAVGLAMAGRKTLLVDLDPQGNATSGLGLGAPASPSLYESLTQELTQPGHESILLPALEPGPAAGLSVAGASPELSGADVELASTTRRDVLAAVLRPLAERHDYLIIDTPPSLSLLTVNALAAADQLLIPVQCEFFALEGLGHLLRTLERIKRSLNPRLSVLGLLRTMYDSRAGLSSQVSKEIQSHFPQLTFDTIIPRNVRLAEAPSFGRPIEQFDRRSSGAAAYRNLTAEVLKRTAGSGSRMQE